MIFPSKYVTYRISYTTIICALKNAFVSQRLTRLNITIFTSRVVVDKVDSAVLNFRDFKYKFK